MLNDVQALLLPTLSTGYAHDLRLVRLPRIYLQEFLETVDFLSVSIQSSASSPELPVLLQFIGTSDDHPFGAPNPRPGRTLATTHIS